MIDGHMVIPVRRDSQATEDAVEHGAAAHRGDLIIAFHRLQRAADQQRRTKASAQLGLRILSVGQCMSGPPPDMISLTGQSVLADSHTPDKTCVEKPPWRLSLVVARVCAAWTVIAWACAE